MLSHNAYDPTPAAGLSRYTIVAFRKVNFPALFLVIEPRPCTRQAGAAAGWDQVGGQRKKLEPKWTAAFFMAPAAGLEPAA